MFFALQHDADGNGIGVHFYAEQPMGLPPGEVACSAEHAADPTTYRIVNGTVQASVTAFKAARTSAMKDVCGSAIVAGFVSSALGAVHNYGSQSTDQANIDRACVDGGALWCVGSSGIWLLVSHTAVQATQVRADLWAHIQACQMKYAGLLAQVSEATTITAVQAIDWRSPDIDEKR